MISFLQQHAGDVIGQLKGWDRLRLRGTLRCIAHAQGLKGFLLRSGRKLADFGKYATESSRQLGQAIQRMAQEAGRPLIYLSKPSQRKEDVAREIAERDRVKEGLICVLTAVEPCWSFSLVQTKEGEPVGVRGAYRKCLHSYQYYLHPVFGFMHLRLQTWMPFNLHLCLNGREWLARQMDVAGIEYRRRRNCFEWIQDLDAAGSLCRQQVQFPWEATLREMARQMNPAIATVMHPYEVDYYWSIEESEWATDILFRSQATLSRLYPSLIRHGMESFGSRDILRFLGQRVPLEANAFPNDRRDIVTDVKERVEGIRIKHRLGANSLKMYNKQGSVLRVETTVNNVDQLRTPRWEKGKVVWKEMRKGVADARRRAEVSDEANERYLEALAAVGHPVPLKTLTAGLSSRRSWKGQKVRGLNLFAEEDVKLLEIVGGGQFLLNGLRNRDLQAAWFDKPSDDPAERRRRSGKISRKLRMLRAHGLIHKLPGTHRYLVSPKGRQVIAALIAARNADITQLSKAA